MYQLYYAPGAASLAVHVILHETGAPFTAKKLDMAKGEHKTPEYLALNPSGVVPTLVVDGKARTESAALCLLLAERHPEAGLLPTEYQGEILLWLFYAATILQPVSQLFFYPERYTGPAGLEDTRRMAAERLMAAWPRLEARLAEGAGPYLFGDRPTVADIYLGMMARWGRALPVPPTRLPAVERFARALTARPSWENTRLAEGHADWIF